MTKKEKDKADKELLDTMNAAVSGLLASGHYILSDEYDESEDGGFPVRATPKKIAKMAYDIADQILEKVDSIYEADEP